MAQQPTAQHANPEASARRRPAPPPHGRGDSSQHERLHEQLCVASEPVPASSRLAAPRASIRCSAACGVNPGLPPELRETHGFENPYDDPVVFEGVSGPGLRLIHALATLFGLAREGRLRDDGTPRFLQAMVFARAMEETLYLASPPLPVQRALWTLFAPIGRLRGYRPTYERFLKPGNWTPVP